MKRLSTSIVKDAHAYTRSRSPWLLDSGKAAQEETTAHGHTGWRLFHYLSGGGLRAFGRTVQQEEADAKRVRFLIKAAILGVMWLYFWI